MRWRWALPGAASFKPGALTTARTFERTRQHIMRDVAAMAAGGTGDLNEHDPALPDRGSSFVNKRRVTANFLGETRHPPSSCSGERKARRQVATVAGDEPDTATIAPRHDAEAVMLDLVQPVRPGRWSLAG
jgi:hypothetical protein